MIVNSRRCLVFLLVLLSLFAASCSQKEEMPYILVQFANENEGFTSNDINLTCIVDSSVPVDNLTIRLTDDFGRVSEVETKEVQTLTTIPFTDLEDGNYISQCSVCAQGYCNQSSEGSVLISANPIIGDQLTFDLPPTFVLGTPIDETYFLSDHNLAITFSCLANDDIGLSAISLITNISGVLSEAFIQKPSTSSFLLTKTLVLAPGTYLWTCRATDRRAQTTVAPIRSFTIGPATEVVLPQINTFDGGTTDFSSLDTLTDVSDVTLENTDYGKIQFIENISSLVGVDLDEGVIISQNSISVNSTLYPQLNVPARLSFYNIVYDAELEDLLINKDDQQYLGFEDLDYDDGVLEFTVQNFSTYTVVVTPKGGYDVVVEETDKENETISDQPTSISEQDEIDPTEIEAEFIETGDFENSFDESEDEVIDESEEDLLEIEVDGEVDSEAEFIELDLIDEESEPVNQEIITEDSLDNDVDAQPVDPTSKTLTGWLMFGMSVLLFLIIFAIIRYNKHKSQVTILHQADKSKYKFK